MTAAAANTRKGALKSFLPAFTIIALAVGAIFLIHEGYQVKKSQTPAGEAVELRVGAKFPDFSLKRFGGGTVKFSELKGKVFLVNFWATWCEACVLEMPSLIKLRESYKDRGFEMIAVSLDEDAEKVLPGALKQFGISFPVYLDQESGLSDLFDIHAIPLTVILNKNREVLMIENGERDWNGSDIRRLVERWLAG